jgi:hypothetical protein
MSDSFRYRNLSAEPDELVTHVLNECANDGYLLVDYDLHSLKFLWVKDDVTPKVFAGVIG